MITFINTIWDLCDVKKKYRSSETTQRVLDKIVGEIAKSESKSQSLSDSFLQNEYKKTGYFEKGGSLIFSTMFLGVMKWSSDIGLCSNNSVLQFGRGTAFLGSAIGVLYINCGECGKNRICVDKCGKNVDCLSKCRETCPEWLIAQKVFTPNILSNPFHCKTINTALKQIRHNFRMGDPTKK
jgi:hypothetical protein